jgi:O-antigen/teichoic acid export membrane protein
MMLSTSVLNLSMVLYHRQMSSRLGEGYGKLSALIGLTNLFAVLTTGFSTYLTKVFSRDFAVGGEEAMRARLWKMRGRLTLSFLLAAGFLAVAGWSLAGFLRVPLAWYAWISLATLAGLVLALEQSALRGLHRFVALGNLFMVQGLGQAAISIYLVSAGAGVSGALQGPVLAAFLAVLVGLPALRPGRIPGQSLVASHAGGLPELAKDTLALGLFSFFCYADILMVNHYFPEGAVSLYSRAALVAKSFLYAATAFNLVLLPVVSARHAQGGEPRALLMKFLGAMAVVELAGLALVWAFPGWIIRLLCGPDPQWLTQAPLIGWFSAAVIPLALFQLLLFYHLSVRQPGVLRLAGGLAAGYMALLFFFHGSLGQVVACLGAVSTSAFAGGLLLSFRKPPPAHGLAAEEGLALATEKPV